MTNEVVITGSGAEHNLATFERRLPGRCKLFAQSGHRGFDLAEDLLGVLHRRGATASHRVLSKTVGIRIPQVPSVVRSRLVVRAVQHVCVGRKGFACLLEIALLNDSRQSLECRLGGGMHARKFYVNNGACSRHQGCRMRNNQRRLVLVGFRSDIT